MRIQRKDAARRSRNQRSADRRVRELRASGLEHADLAVRAPGKSSQDASLLADSTAKTQRGRAATKPPTRINLRDAINAEKSHRTQSSAAIASRRLIGFPQNLRGMKRCREIALQSETRFRDLLKTTLFLLILVTLSTTPLFAVENQQTNQSLGFFVVSEVKAETARYIDTDKLPKVGYVAAKPDLEFTQLESVVLEFAKRPVTLTNQNAQQELKYEKKPTFRVGLLPQDRQRFTDFTEKHLSKQIVIMIGDQPLIAPKIVARLDAPSFQIDVLNEKDMEAIHTSLNKLVKPQAGKNNAAVQKPGS